MFRVSVDSNILIYAEGADESAKRAAAIAVIERIGHANVVLTMQAAGETLRWLIRHGRFGRNGAVARLRWWIERCETLPVSVSAFRKALVLVEDHAFQLWDAVILASSAEAEASVLLSEDMQHGFTWNGVTIVNPFILKPEDLNKLMPPKTLH